MELVSTMEINGEEREIADAYARGQIDAINNNLSVIGKCKNLLNPTLATTTVNGVTCTANGDGTYTLNGTSTDGDKFKLKVGTVNLEIGKKYKIIGYENASPVYYMKADINNIVSNENNGIFTNKVETEDIYIKFYGSGVTFDNVIVKPMITEDLAATYDDFVPYTGDGDTLTEDVAELKNDLSEKLKVISVSLEGITIEGNGSTTVSLPQEYIDAGYVIANVLKKESGIGYTVSSETSILVSNYSSSAVTFAPTATIPVLIAKIG